MSGRERAAAWPCVEALKVTGREGRRAVGGVAGCQGARPLCNLTSGLHLQQEPHAQTLRLTAPALTWRPSDTEIKATRRRGAG